MLAPAWYGVGAYCKLDEEARLLPGAAGHTGIDKDGVAVLRGTFCPILEMVRLAPRRQI